MNKPVRYLPFAGLIAGLALAVGMAPVQAGDAPAGVKKTFDKLLGAVKTANRDAFVADATDAVKEGTTQEIMDGLKKQLGGRLEKGYKATYLCQLKQAGHQVHLWKLAFKDEDDDIVIRIALKDGKVAGLFFQ